MKKLNEILEYLKSDELMLMIENYTKVSEDDKGNNKEYDKAMDKHASIVSKTKYLINMHDNSPIVT